MSVPTANTIDQPVYNRQMADFAPSSPEPAAQDRALFTSRSPEPERNTAVSWIIAAAVVLLVLGGFFLTSHRKAAAPNTPLAAAAYSSSLVITDLKLSESSALSGVKVTYIDGMIRNDGQKTVTAATAQVQFGNDEQLPPQLESVPITLIRTHEPYTDTEPLSAAPLQPGQQHEFRLIFENINSNWNQQLPLIRITEVSTR